MTADWMRDGLCRLKAYAPLFTGERPVGMPRKKWTAAAKGVCGRCSVLEVCREWVTANETGKTGAHHSGVVGGLDAKERGEIARGGAR
jgi:hypothetical protein